MKRSVRNLVLLLCACAAGGAASELLYRTPWCRDAIGHLLGRGDFLALVRDRVIYEGDLFQPGDPTVETMLAAEALRQSPRGAQVSVEEVEREVGLLHAQFGDERIFVAALESARLTEPLLRVMVTDHLEVRHWIEEQIAPELKISDAECQLIYEKDHARFELPPRFRASHLFIAAPEGTDSAMVLTKSSLAQGLSVRILAGESLEDLAAEASEDESTKDQGGDLGYFSAWRMPPDFMAELEKLSVGQTSSPIRCHLGFHIVAFTEMKPARELTFDEARAEIAAQVANQKRATAVASITGQIRRPEWTRATVRRP